ncbi:MAG: hypothetical protein K2P98_02640, partial [Neisseriaceae bacterium]|nr:hypothetical protein [Neisseriaceae bacterium]
EAIGKWNELHTEKHGIVMQAIGWDSHSYPSMAYTPQEVINQQVLDDADLLIGIFWSRIGRPTENHESGTVEEIHRHLSAEKPTMLFFSSEPIPESHVSSEQLTKLKKYKEEYKQKGLVAYYQKNEFKDKIYEALVRFVNEKEHFIFFDKNLNKPLLKSEVNDASLPLGSSKTDFEGWLISENLKKIEVIVLIYFLHIRDNQRLKLWAGQNEDGALSHIEFFLVPFPHLVISKEDYGNVLNNFEELGFIEPFRYCSHELKSRDNRPNEYKIKEEVMTCLSKKIVGDVIWENFRKIMQNP